MIWKFPCGEGMKMPPGEKRREHIRGCQRCQDLILFRKTLGL